MTTQVLAAGGFRFIPAVSQYSGGVAAEPGFRIERARFSKVVPLREGFERIERHLASIGRPGTAFCACELRSPAPFTEQGFREFNAVYLVTLRRWGLMGDDGVNPVARSNVCPDLDPPAEPGFHAFSYTVPDANAAPSFIVAGSGEAPEGKGDYRDNVIARGDLSPEGLRTKARWVLGEMENRLRTLGFGWGDCTATQVYTVHDIHPFIGDELVRRGAMRAGLTWHFNRPPILELEYEMDCRGVPLERVLAV
ncbi:2-amino-5-chloromuconate deaminase CnbZ [Zeimonas arvi]|uniref:2-amino-5-chloromuconate deaminase CnbZ n=1 Tax=Zeimonas arvi TaxID=2498847 RepID=UPI003899D454